MKPITKEFVQLQNQEAGTQPTARVNIYSKYPGKIRSASGSTCTVYGNASRFFFTGDKIIIKTALLDTEGTITNSPTFDGTVTTVVLSGVTFIADNVGGFLLRDIDFKYTI